MKTAKKLIAVILTLALSASLVIAAPVRAAAEETGTVANRFNVVLVIDKSGSLRNQAGVGTDPNGLRYDAMKLFLGLLTETGNRVGVVVFDDAIRYDSGLRAIDSLEEKKELVSAAEALGTSYDTDIGTAVLRATELLKGMREENGLPCAILLLTDGMTDFPMGANQWIRMTASREAAQKALQTAQEEGITIHGILLNVDGRAERGIEELHAYTDGTDGEFEAVSSPEDLTATFARFYSIINQTEYTGAHKIVFSDLGEAQTGFHVPPFGMEEVNIVIEHDAENGDGAFGGLEEVHIARPDGLAYDAESHMFSTSRFLLIKIPGPTPGTWDVKLKGNPGDSIDICLIYNASLSAELSVEKDEEDFRVLKPVTFHAVVTDAGMPISEEQLASIEALLRVTNLASGESRDYPMTMSDGAYVCEITFEDGGDYSMTAKVGLTDFEIRSNTLKATVAVPPPAAKRDGISALTEAGSVSGNVWELDLNTLFEDPKGTQMRYTLSDDCGGAVTVGENGVLRADLSEINRLSITVTATDAYGLSAEIPFDLAIERPSPRLESVSDMLENGSFRGELWEIDLNSLFEGGKALTYTLSDDLGGALSMEDGVLQARLAGMEEARFTVTATGADGLSTDLPFTLTVPAPAPALESVASLKEAGSVRDNVWELDLNALFEDPKGTELRYTLSDDCGGAVTIGENGVLRADLSELDRLSLTVTATDAYGLDAEIPFDLSIKRPAPRLESVTDTLENGSFRGELWEIDLNSLFGADSENALTYTLSDDLNGALSVEDGVLQAHMAGIDAAAFTVTATNADGLSAVLPFLLNVPPLEALAESVASPAEAGSVSGNVWELDLNTLFAEPTGTGLSFTLSDDCGAAVTIGDDGVLRADLSELDSLSFTVTAADAFGRSAQLPVAFDIERPSAGLESVADMLESGSFRDDLWEIDLNSLFGSENGALSYTLSDDLNGALTVEDGVLKARLSGVEAASFTVTATNADGLSADLPFELSVPTPELTVESVSSLAEAGGVRDNVWELDLSTLFADPKGTGLQYALSDDCGGAVTIDDNGVLRADLAELDNLSFTVTATDALGLSAELPVELDIDRPTPKVESVTDTLESGSFRDDLWEIDLNSLFVGEKELTYTLFDDLGGALSVEDGVLQLHLEGVDSAAFTVTATDADGLSTELPFAFAVPTPEAAVESVSSLTEAGSVRDNVWELELSTLFEDPKGTEVSYALSDDCGGAVTIDENGVLRADLSELDNLSFTVTATDAVGFTAELPVALDINRPSPVTESVSSLAEQGSVSENVWELDLGALFEDPTGAGLQYTLSDDCGGAVTIGENGLLRADLSELEQLSFTVTATDELGFTAELPVSFDVDRPSPKVEGVTDALESGSFRGELWEIDLDSLFDGNNELTYTLSDDLNGALAVEDGVLQGHLSGVDKASFTVTATGADGLSAELPFEFSVPAPEAAVESVSSLSELGSVRDNAWELDLNALFEDPKGTGLHYTLSDDCSGAVTIGENGLLRADLSELEQLSFTVTATDELGFTAELPVSFDVDRPSPKVESVNDMLENGSFRDDLWEIDLDSLFDGEKELTYTLSDDLNGALSLEDGVLRARLAGIDQAAFTVTATNADGLSAELPFELRVPGPEALVESVSETVKTGWFQKDVWAMPLGDLFRDPKGTALSYTLSDDCGGAVTITGDVLTAKCLGIGTASFVVSAEDPCGLRAEVPVTLTENNITWIYILVLLLAVFGSGAGIYFSKRRRSAGK